MKCIVCENSKLSDFLTIKNAPRNVQRLLSDKVLQADKKIIIKILKCEKCRLIQLSKESYVNDDYYEDYLMSRSFSPFSQKYQKALAKEFVEKFSLKNKNIMEVGCGDGLFASKLSMFGAKVIGIEPSDKACELARKRGVEVLQKYVNDKLEINELFDAFTACQVFEHISNPANLLKNVKRFLKPDSFGLIEVPSVVKTLVDNRYYDFFPDHVAYFSPTSLGYMCELNGFEVLEIKHTANNEYITASIKKSPNYLNQQEQFNNYRQSYISFFEKIKNKNIAIWGAGAKGIASLSFSGIGTNQVLFCVDSDPNKWGKYLPGSHIKVVSPKLLKSKKVDAVIVTAMMYKDEIITDLQKKYGFRKSQIGIIAPTPRFINKI